MQITINNITFPVYYIDNLCVHSNYRKKGIAAKSIQTLYYNLRRYNEDVKVYLFKREGETTPIVPLTTFDCCMYNISQYPLGKLPHASMKLIQINKQNIILFKNFVFELRARLECVVVPELSNLLHLMDEDLIDIYGIIEGDKLISVYVFRDPATNYDTIKAVELVCSLNACHHNDIFQTGFSEVLTM